jgi:carbamoyl-phosphate synthase large subunit
MSVDVLVTAGSRRVALVRAFQRAVRPAGGRVVVTDVDPLSPTVHIADAAFRVPLSTDPSYLAAIAEVCERERIGLIVPTIDEELPIFGAAAPLFEGKGVRVAASPERTARICNDKQALCEHLRAAGIAAAQSWLPEDLPANPSLPLFIKPRSARGSVGAHPVRTRRELDFFLDYVHDPIVQELLEGPEFTIDLLCGFDSVPRAVVPRERRVVRAGVIDKGRTVDDPTLIKLARECAAVLDFVGAVNIQCRIVNGTPTVFEINPRFSGGISLTIAAGADFARMLVDLARGREVGPGLAPFRADMWMTNFEEAIFLSREDAVIDPTEPEDKRVRPFKQEPSYPRTLAPSQPRSRVLS